MPAHRDAHAALSAWVIRRWFDPGADLLWVPDAHVADVAARFAAQSLLPDQPWTARLSALGMDHPPLARFLTRFDIGTAAEAPLLSALSILHTSEQEWTAASLTLVDTAWAAYRAQEEERP